MMKDNKEKEKITNTTRKSIEKKDNRFDNRYEVLTILPEVAGKVKNNISRDYTLAKLPEEEKEYVVENYANAEYAKEIILRFKNWKKPVWDNEKKEWKKDTKNELVYEELTKEEKDYIQGMADRVFELFMIRTHMIAIVNRNRDDNFLVKLLGEYKEEQQEAWSNDDRNMLQRIKDKVEGNTVGGKE